MSNAAAGALVDSHSHRLGTGQDRDSTEFQCKSPLSIIVDHAYIQTSQGFLREVFEEEVYPNFKVRVWKAAAHHVAVQAGGRHGRRGG